MQKRIVEISKIKDDNKLKKLLSSYGVGLTPDEARKVVKILGRDPTPTELWVFNIEWSEHCSYKSSKLILKKYLPTSSPNVIQGPEEDAGIIYLTTIKGERWGVVIGHESHNHPSQILPYEGAATGIGGIVRDVDCMGAQVIGVADPLRFGSLTSENKNRTKWIISGVVEGIWQYANALGVPNLGGDIVFSECYDDNCLVNVVAIGILKEKDIIHSCVPKEAKFDDYDVILIGKPTDDSGFGGVAFASEILDQSEEKRGAVQVPDPFLKNVLLLGKANRSVWNKAKEMGAVLGFKDLGGGGIACASSEMGSSGGFGIEIDLDKVHVSLPNLLPEIISCAETQERYLLTCPSWFSPYALKIYNEDWDLPNIYEGAGAKIIGKAIKEKRYILKHKDEVVVEVEIDKVTKGITYKRKAKKKKWMEKEPKIPEPKNIDEIVMKILKSPNVASREYIWRFYDTEVQGNAVIRAGEADASVIAPIRGSSVGIALSVDGNPFYGKISPYWGGANAVAEAMRNVACVGATPSGLTDCLNFGNPENEETFWEFKESVRGLSDAAKNLGLKGYKNAPCPVVSGNVSFYNSSSSGIAIDPSPIICCVGIIQDYSFAITSQIKRHDSLLFLVGERYDECGGGEYYREIYNLLGKNVPKIRWEFERGMICSIIDSINKGYILSCHDISIGGLITSLCEMIIGDSNKGLEIEINIENCKWSYLRRLDKILFSESSGLVFEVPLSFEKKVRNIFKKYGIEIYQIGRTISQPFFSIHNQKKEILKIKISEIKDMWQNSLEAAIT